MATWNSERSELLATIQRQQEDAERLAKRFKLLQRTLVDQQTLLDRYQQALVSSGALANSTSKDDNGDISKANTTAADTATSASSSAAKPIAVSKAAIKAKPQTRTVDKHRAVTAVNTVRNATSSILHSTPVIPRVVTQDTDEFATATSASTSSSHSKKRGAITTDTTPSEPKRKVTKVERPSHSTKPTKPTSNAIPSDPSPSKDEASASWITRKADFHRAPPAVMQPTAKPEPSPSPLLSKTTATAPAHQPAALTGVKRKAKSSTDRAPTWAQEKIRMKEAGILVTTGKRRFADLLAVNGPEAAAAVPSQTKGDAYSQSGDKKENAAAFQYVEVVRNREARAALPGHDCVECRKYYEALHGLIPDADAQLAKAKCSRHRAKFEPYNTPDDFWRLSFPDSEPQPLSP